MASQSHNPGTSEHDTVDINIDVEAVPFPSFTSRVTESAQSPVSDSSGALTSSDKLSALPQTITSQSINRVGRSPQIQQSPRMFRNSMDGSRSWPHIASETGWNTFNTTGRVSRHSMSEGSVERGGRGRTSLDSDRGSISGVNSVKRAFRKLSHTSDPSPANAPSAILPEYRKDGDGSSAHSRSRAVSPIRFLQQWSANISRSHILGGNQDREEPFIPVDPFHSFVPAFLSSLFSSQQGPEGKSGRPDGLPSDIEAQTSSPGPSGFCHTNRMSDRQVRTTYIFITVWLPRIVYIYLLLRLPPMYFSRVARIFEDAEVSKPDIQRLVEGCFGGANAYQDDPVDTRNRGASSGQDVQTPQVTPALAKFKHTWEDFIDSLLREWKTLNVVSALLLSAILTLFQIPNAATDPVTRTAALLSLICAIMSLSYGCMYIVRFGSMRSMFRASRWAEEAQRSKTFLLWNVWVMLAMPAVWMSWSMILFIVSILSFVWRTGEVDDPDERAGLSSTAILGPRIAITGVFFIGMLYFFAIVRTLQSYGQVGPLEERKGSRFYVRSAAAAVNDGERRGREPERFSRESGRSGRGRHLDERPREAIQGRGDSTKKEDGEDERNEELKVNSTPKATPVGLGLSGIGSISAAISTMDPAEKEMETKAPHS
ncbi:hypothetical protein E1B28_007053 [Marasmius oreades]|uniref:Uncharacterized protein n=1 Tax=Marasmius oreades TaxID=181124 RepID=A0A9P7S0W4_9AGAR|nr:uncharacterized protein E1B28_007053 [Marasmius oreades]KAG7093371.1 hypothetical protein E1B28_007053 [Marasmius oreades]